VDAPRGNNHLYSLRYSDFIMPLVKSVQELSEENEHLRTENAVLKGKVDMIMQALSDAGIPVKKS
jgi:regulator of replication initiation timing